MKNIINKIAQLFYKKPMKQNTYSNYYNRIKETDHKIGEFYSMEEIPPRDGEEDFSIWVIVYDESDSSYYNIGFYDYEDQVWTAFTDEPMLLKCWCFAPDPSPFWDKKKFKTVYSA